MPEGAQGIVSEFNWVDITALILIGLSSLIAIFRGFTREFFGILGWGGSVLFTLYMMNLTNPIVRKWVGNPILADILNIVVLFIVSLVTFLALSNYLSSKVKGSLFGGVDRALGLLFGIARGALLAILLFVGTFFVWKPEKRPPEIQASKSYPYLVKGTLFMIHLLPSEFRHKRLIESLKLPEDPDSEQLMHMLSRPQPGGASPKVIHPYESEQKNSLDSLVKAADALKETSSSKN